MFEPWLVGTGAGPLPYGGAYIWLASGMTPPGVERVRVELPGFETEVEFEPVTGAFLVAIPDWTPDSSDPEPTRKGAPSRRKRSPRPAGHSLSLYFGNRRTTTSLAERGLRS